MSDPPRDNNLPAGYDESDPYESEDLSTYPEWWRKNVLEFRELDMRPYRPPRLADGTLVPGMIRELEDEFDTDFSFSTTDPGPGDEWEIWMNGERITEVSRERKSEGYSEYDITFDRLVELIQETE